MTLVAIIVATIVGTLLASILSCLPALHIYNISGIVILLGINAGKLGTIPVEAILAFMMSLVVAYSILNSIPSIFLGAPDESAIFITLPGSRYLMMGKGYEAAILTGVGGLGGLFFLMIISPLALSVFPIAKEVVQPHLHWILAAVLGFMVMSEWPKGGDRGINRRQRFWRAWQNLIAGLATLILSAILGFIILDRPVIPIENAFQNIMPAFVGLFAVPWVIQNISSVQNPPSQHFPQTVDMTATMFLRGSGAGCMGGLFAAFFPIVTGGMGGLLAAHATAQRDDRLFIISQGASKTVYYVGSFMLLFVPGLELTRGGMSWMMSGIHQPTGTAHYYMIVGVIALSGAMSFYLLALFSRWTIYVITCINYRLLSLFTLCLITIVVFYMCKWQGLWVMIIATGIGMIPVFFHSRRMNCMGVLLIPIMLKQAGYGSVIAKFLGLH